MDIWYKNLVLEVMLEVVGKVRAFGVCKFIGIPWHYLLRDT